MGEANEFPIQEKLNYYEYGNFRDEISFTVR